MVSAEGAPASPEQPSRNANAKVEAIARIVNHSVTRTIERAIYRGDATSRDEKIEEAVA